MVSERTEESAAAVRRLLRRTRQKSNTSNYSDSSCDSDGNASPKHNNNYKNRSTRRGRQGSDRFSVYEGVDGTVERDEGESTLHYKAKVQADVRSERASRMNEN